MFVLCKKEKLLYMISITYKEKYIYIIATILIFSSYLLNYYISVFFSFFDIFFAFFILFRCVNKGKISISNIQINSLFIFLYLVVILVVSILKGGSQWGFFGKETLRFSSFLFLYFIFLIKEVNREIILKTALVLCQIHVFYTIYELLYINIFNIGNIEGLIFGNAIIDFFKGDESSQYFLQQSELGIPFIRPFGVMLLPQKSGFVFILGYILKYRLASEGSKRSYIWYILFALSTICTGAKTAIVCLFLVIIVLELNVYPKIKYRKRDFVFFYFLFFLLLELFLYNICDNESVNEHVVVNDVQNDFFALFNMPILNVFFGSGFLNDDILHLYGFICESYLMRFISQIGWVNFFLVLSASLYVMRVQNEKYNWVFLALFFCLLIHYFALAPFYLFVLSALLAELKLEENIK